MNKKRSLKEENKWRDKGKKTNTDLWAASLCDLIWCQAQP